MLRLTQLFVQQLGGAQQLEQLESNLLVVAIVQPFPLAVVALLALCMGSLVADS